MKRPRVHRDRIVATRITTPEWGRWDRIATDAGLSLSELVREGVRTYLRVLERDVREGRTGDEGAAP